MLTNTIATLTGAFALVLLAMVATLFVIVHDANKTEAERQAQRVDIAIESQARLHRQAIDHFIADDDIRAVLASGAPRPELQQVFQTAAAGMLQYEGAYLTTAGGEVFAGIERGEAAGQEAFDALRQEVGGFPWAADHLRASDHGLGTGRTRTRLAVRGGRTRSVTIAELRGLPWPQGREGARPELLVVYRTLSADALRAVGTRYRINDFRVTQDTPSDPMSRRPLLAGDGTVSAWVTWTPDRPGDGMWRQFAAAVLIMAVLFGGILFLVIRRLHGAAHEIDRHESKIQLLAALDELSGLPNRRSFDLQLGQELTKLDRAGTGLAVLLLDLDRFKIVNDTYGHTCGDELIRHVAERLVRIVRTDDIVARLGGDEFGIIQSIAYDQKASTALGQRILDALTSPFLIGGVEVTIGCSIGIAHAPADGTDRETLLRLADTALYQAKNEGRNRFVCFEPRMNRSLQLKRMVEEDLRQAINNDGLALHYQPQISVDGSTIVGVEALVRWPHPVHGMIPPSEFISIAEERGLIVPLSEWVLRRACKEAKRWSGLKLAVNVSPVQFRHKDFVANIIRIVEETGFEPARLELELTEGVVVEDADAAENALMDLRAYGIGLALDDFGIGYSSLIYLRRFAFDKIKIDRSFLEYMEMTGESAILVHSVVHLGRALGLRVCAEGVETSEQHRFLQAIGCHEVQGFLFSKPVPAEAIDELLRQDQPFASILAA